MSKFIVPIYVSIEHLRGRISFIYTYMAGVEFGCILFDIMPVAAHLAPWLLLSVVENQWKLPKYNAVCIPSIDCVVNEYLLVITST